MGTLVFYTFLVLDSIYVHTCARNRIVSSEAKTTPDNDISWAKTVITIPNQV